MPLSVRSRVLLFAIVAALASAGLTAQAKAKSGSVTGTLEKVDGPTLIVQTSKGTERVMLAPTSRIRRGTKTLTAKDLPAETGRRVKVTYTEASGQKHATMVSVSSAAEAKSAARK